MQAQILACIQRELRTSISAIIGVASLLENEVDDSYKDSVRMIKQSGGQLVESFTEILDMARLAEDAVFLEPSRIDVLEVINDVMAESKAAASHKDVMLVSNLPINPVNVELDRYCLHTVLHHLILNAVKFTEVGYVRIELETASDEIFICVHDTGVGISKDFLPDVFEPFTQETRSELMRYLDGTGLGLAIALGMTRLLGGWIRVRSSEGAGSSFILRLPRRASGSQPQGRSILPADLLLKAERRVNGNGTLSL